MAEINQTAEMDPAPLGNVPTLIGLCADHGWWFEARRVGESCPESGCLAPTHFYAAVAPEEGSRAS